MSSPAPQAGEDGRESPPPYNSLVHSVDNSTQSDQRDNLPPPYFHLENVFDAPPDYYSIFVNRLDSDGRRGIHWSCLKKALHIVLSTVGFSVLLLVFMSVPIAMLVIGAIFVGKCPAQPNIPVFLVVAGIAGILKSLFLISERLATRQLHQRTPPQTCPAWVGGRAVRCSWRLFNMSFNLFMLSWIISGSYWVYHMYSKVAHDGFASCNEVVYKFAFGTITASYIILVLVVTCVCCCGLCLKRNTPQHPVPEEVDQELDPIQNHGAGGEEEEVEEEEEEEDRYSAAVEEQENGGTQLQSESGDPDTEALTEPSAPAPLSAVPNSSATPSYLSTVV